MLVPRRRRYDYGPLVEGARLATTIAGAVPGARELARGVKRTYNSISELLDSRERRIRTGGTTSRFEQRLGLGPPRRVPNPELGPPRPPAMPPRLATGGPAGGVKFSKEEHVIGKKRRREYCKLSDVIAQMFRARTRWQLCSNTLTGPGRIPISYGGYGTTDLQHHSLPIHFISLSQFVSPTSLVNTNKGSYKHGLYRVIRNEIADTIGCMNYECNTYEGVNNYDPNGYPQYEITPYNEVDNNSTYHKWSEVKMNLYGAKHIPLTYTISLVTCPKEYDPLSVQPVGNVDLATPPATNHPTFSPFARWVEDVARTLLCNTLNEPGTDKEYKKNVTIIKQYSTTIQPLSYTNAAAEGQAAVKVGNVREFKFFMRHDRWREYFWAENQENVTVDRPWQDLGWDVHNVINRPYTDEKWGKRVYMFITCTTGAITDGPQNDVRTKRPVQLDDIPNDFGSYDLIVRNEYYYH